MLLSGLTLCFVKGLSMEDKELNKKSGVEPSNQADTSSGDETNSTSENLKRKERKGSSSEPDDNGEQDDSHVQKKKRLIWTSEMHQKFLDAIAQIGHDSKCSYDYHLIRACTSIFNRVIEFLIIYESVCVKGPFRRRS